MENSTEINSVRDYLKWQYEAMMHFHKDKSTGREDWKYQMIEEFVLSEGQNFKPATLPEGVERGTIKECFCNALLLVLDSDDDLIYCEGYADGSVIPVHHAWCVTRDGVVIDPTWRNLGAEYVGVPFKVEWVREAVFKRGSYGIIDNWENEWPLLKGLNHKEYTEELL